MPHYWFLNVLGLDSEVSTLSDVGSVAPKQTDLPHYYVAWDDRLDLSD